MAVQIGYESEWADIGGDRQLPVRFWLESPSWTDEPAWRIDFEVRDGHPRCRRVVVEAGDRGPEVRSVHLRTLLIEDLLEGAATNVARQTVVDEHGVTTWVRTGFRDWRDVVKDVRGARRGRPRMTDEALSVVADVYRANVNDKPTKAVAEQFNVADRTARLYVKRARDAGFLGSAVPGKGGEAH
jgi:hypothetical protein